MENRQKADFIGDFVKSMQKDGLSDKTVTLREITLGAWFDFLELKNIEFDEKLSDTIFMSFIEHRSHKNGKELARNTKVMYWRLLNEFYLYLMNQGVIDHNPMDCVREVAKLYPRPRGRQEKLKPVVLNESEMKLLISENMQVSNSYVRQRQRIAILLGLLCGLRNMEIRELTVQDLFLDNNPPYLRVMGKYQKERFVPIPAQLAELLDDWLFLRRERMTCDCDILLASRTGGHGYSPSGLCRLVKAEFKRLGIVKRRMSPHILRHTYCSALFAKGAPPQKIRDLMGHENMATTLIYEHTAIFGGLDYILDNIISPHEGRTNVAQ